MRHRAFAKREGLEAILFAVDALKLLDLIALETT
jgi:hypothetical protein